MDDKNLSDLARFIFKVLKEKTKDGHNVLLTCDAYRSHNTFCALRILKNGSVIVYHFPSRISDKALQLDFVLNRTFENYLKATVFDAKQIRKDMLFDHFDLLDMIHEACTCIITTSNVIKEIKKAGLLP